MKKDESVLPKETKQAQEDSVASVKNTDPPQVIMEECFATKYPVVLVEGGVPSVLVSKSLQIWQTIEGCGAQERKILCIN